MTWQPPRAAGPEEDCSRGQDFTAQPRPGQGRQAEREEAQPEREGSCRHDKAAFRFNTRQQGSGWGGPPAPHRTINSCWGHSWRIPKRPGLITEDTPRLTTGKRGLFTTPQPAPSMGSPTPAPHLPHSRLSRPHPGSRAVPCRPAPPGSRSAQPGFVLLSVQGCD